MSSSLSSYELEGMLSKIEEIERGGTYAESSSQAKGGTPAELGSQADIFSSNFTSPLMIKFLDLG